MEKGLLIVVSGPSGAGKGTICKKLIKLDSNLKMSISATTRKPRKGEIEGINYFFIEEKQFENMILNKEFIEHALVYGNYYGTPKSNVMNEINAGKDIILEIDIQGALEVKEKYPEATFIFILPPSIKELERRIVGRGTDSKETILKRMKCVYEELNFAFKYDYVVVNDIVDNAAEKIKCIITAEKNKVNRKHRLIQKIREE